MAKAEARPKAKEEKEEVTVSHEAHDAPGLSPYERMMELARLAKVSGWPERT
jgi:hypothetical protein